MIRLATTKDADALLHIYSPFILHSGITQETVVPSITEFKSRIEHTLTERPWLVAEINGTVAGYAYAGKHRERKGYQWCIEPSVYLHADFYGKKNCNSIIHCFIRPVENTRLCKCICRDYITQRKQCFLS